MRALLVAVLALAATPAAAWKQSTSSDTGVCLAWGERAVGWSAASPLGGQVPEEEALEVFRRSFGVWEAESCSDLRFVEGPRSQRITGFNPKGANTDALVVRERTCDEVVPDGDPCISRRSCANEYDCWEFGDGVIAMTTVTSSNCSGRIVDADIEFNAASFRFTAVDGPRCDDPRQSGCVEMDLQNTVVHEIGHMIGLDHSEDRDATMFRTASPGETSKRALAQDDREALCAVYPKGRAARTCGPAASPAECETRRQRYHSRSGCASAGGGGGGALLAVFMAEASRRLRRRA